MLTNIFYISILLPFTKDVIFQDEPCLEALILEDTQKIEISEDSETMKITCKNCNNETPYDSVFCIHCGKKIIPTTMKTIIGTFLVALFALIGIGVIGTIIVGLGIDIVYGVQLASGDAVRSVYTYIILTSVFEIVLVLPVYWHYDDINASLRWSGLVPIDKVRAIKDFLICGAIGFMVGLFISLISPFLGIGSYIAYFLPPEIIFGLLIATIIIGFSEEVLFRGFIQQALDYKCSKRKVVPVVLAALLFALAHISLNKIPLIFLLGLLIGYLYEKFNRQLYGPIGFHTIYDFTVFIFPTIYALLTM